MPKLNEEWSLPGEGEFAIAITVCAALICFMFILMRLGEHFTSKREKAEAIHDWFSSKGANNPPKYVDYKSNIQFSDVLEYSAVKKGGGSSASIAVIESHIN